MSATPTNWTDTQIVTTVPSGAVTGSLVVTVDGVASCSTLFTVNYPPNITGISQSSATVGTTITIAAVLLAAGIPPYSSGLRPKLWQRLVIAELNRDHSPRSLFLTPQNPIVL